MNSCRKTLLGLTVLFLALSVFIPQLYAVDSGVILDALNKVDSRCPDNYPEVVTSLPEPGQLSGTGDEKLFAMITTWNPALRNAVAAELAERGDKVLPKLKALIVSENWKEREAAAGVIASLVRHNMRNWKSIYPEEKNSRIAQDNIRKKYLDLIPLILPLLKDKQRGVRQNALNAIAEIQPKEKEVSEAVLELFGDSDEYLAQNAMLAIEKRIGLNGADEAKVLAAFEKGIKQPLPRGKGHFIRIISQQNKDFQKKCIPLLIEHLNWNPIRDTMFGSSGQEQAIQLLTRMKRPELIPLLPKLMNKKYKDRNEYYDASVKAIGEYGPAAKKLLPVLKAEIPKVEKQLAELEKKGVNRRTKKPIEALRKRLEILNEAVKNVEK